MSVTEFALLRLLPSITTTSPTLPANLKAARDAMQSFSGFPFSFYSCVEDPDIIFIIGGWPSAKFHWESWIPSKQNQGLLSLFEDEVEVELMFHVDVNRRELEGIEERGVVAVRRHKVGDDEKKGLKDNLERAVVGSERMIGGWRVEQGFVKGKELVTDGLGGETEEWVLFAGLSRDEHMAVAQTEESKKYSRFLKEVEEVDVKHGVKMEI